MSDSDLATAYPEEQTRLVQLLHDYADLGLVGAFGYAGILETLVASFRAAAQHDTVEMIRVYQVMKGHS